MATTTNYGWTTPDNTALVKDGASAIRTLGSSVDTTVKALSPGTTAGDVDYYTSSTAKARLGIGTTGQILTVAGGVPSWASPAAASAYTSLASGTLSSNTLTISSISSAYTDLRLYVTGIDLNVDGDVFIRLNGDTAANYAYAVLRSAATTTSVSTSNDSIVTNATQVGGTATNVSYYIDIPNYSGTDNLKSVNVQSAMRTGGGIKFSSYSQGMYNSASAISSITVFTDAGSWTGSYKLLGVK
jgi:hypothetical protein